MHPRVQAQRIARAELVIVYPRGQFKGVGDRIPLSDLAGRDVIGISTSGPVGDLLDASLAKLGGRGYREVVTAHTFFVATALVREGVGVKPTTRCASRA